MKNIDDVANAIVTLQVNAETKDEKNLVDHFQEFLLKIMAGVKDNPRAKVKRVKKKSPVKKTCPNCGKEFVQARAYQKFCSGKCKDYWKNHIDLSHLVERTCAVCGKKFFSRTNNPKKYCSPECISKGRSMSGLKGAKIRWGKYSTCKNVA